MYHQFTISLPEPYRAALGSRLIALGSLGVEERTDALIAYFPGTIDQDPILKELDLLRILFRNLVDPADQGTASRSLSTPEWPSGPATTKQHAPASS
jgi:hypothetical protein